MIPAQEYYDDEKSEFISTETKTLRLEHSLVSLSKWESIWEIPFLDGGQKTNEQLISYVKCMMLEEVDVDFNLLPADLWTEIQNYIDSKQSATWFPEEKKTARSREVITSEIIYYWMVAHKINWEAQHWHLNRLITLVRTISAKSQPEKKMSKSELAARNRALNAQRRARTGSKG